MSHLLPGHHFLSLSHQTYHHHLPPLLQTPPPHQMVQGLAQDYTKKFKYLLNYIFLFTTPFLCTLPSPLSSPPSVCHTSPDVVSPALSLLPWLAFPKMIIKETYVILDFHSYCFCCFLFTFSRLLLLFFIITSHFRHGLMRSKHLIWRRCSEPTGSIIFSIIILKENFNR